MPISAARWSASSRWWTAWCCWWTPPKSVMPQTKFVLSKALKLGLKPIVVINKIDRSDAQPHETLESIFDLFLALEANDDQLDFHDLYASGRNGWAVDELEDERKDLTPLFHRIVADVPPPRAASRCRRRTSLQDAGDDAGGRQLSRPRAHRPHRIGRDHRQPRQIKALNREGKEIERARVTKLLAFRGLARVPVDARRGRRHRRHRRASDRHRRRHAVRHGGGGADPRQPDRSADAGHDHLGQRFPAGRPRGRQGAEPRHPRAAAARGRRQCRDQGHGDRRRRLRGGRPRRTAARRADRNHAPRGLRAFDLAARACSSRPARTASGWSRSRKSPSTSTIPMPAW